jgi:hypothetical protein
LGWQKRTQRDIASLPVRRPFVAVAVAMPALKSATGIDGGAIFQILAAEDLGLDSRAIGIAFAMGVLSLPVQLIAARLPLSRARQHLQSSLPSPPSSAGFSRFSSGSTWRVNGSPWWHSV